MERGEGKPRNGDHFLKNFHKGKWRNGGEMWVKKGFTSRDEEILQNIYILMRTVQ